MGIGAADHPGAATDVEPEPSSAQRWKNRAPLLIVLVLTLIGVGTVLYGVMLPDTEEPLDSASHAIVQQACEGALRDLKALPALTHNTTRAELAARITEENSVFAAMTKQFDTAQPTNGDGRTALRAWTADWRTVLARRAQYVQQLGATKEHIDFIVPIDDSKAPVTDRMNQYSRTHDLHECLSENLQLETVDTIRNYPKSNKAGD